jgi:hypothetical protein
MTIQEKTIKLAEAAGWRLFSSFDNLWAPPGHVVEYDCDAYPLPDYFRCLNAVNELEKILTDEDWELYQNHLESIIDPVKNWIHSTAAQRCEAIGKTLGLW